MLGLIWIQTVSHSEDISDRNLWKTILKKISRWQKRMQNYPVNSNIFTISVKKFGSRLGPTLCMLSNFSCLCCHLLTFFKINFFKQIFQEHYQSVKHFESRSGPTFCRSWSGSKLFAKVINNWQKSTQARKELIILLNYKRNTYDW